MCFDCQDAPVWSLVFLSNFTNSMNNNLNIYLSKVAVQFDCGDDEMVGHIEELLEELKEVQSDDDDDDGGGDGEGGEDEDEGEDWTTDEEN